MASTMAAEAEDEREFDYTVGGERGPTKWGEIKEEWKAYGKGELQSPIDTWSERVRVIPKAGEIQRSYKPSNASVKNRGHDIRLLGRIMSNITGGDKNEEREVGVIDPRQIKMGGRSYFKYVGSLTVPPCTEGVIWIMNKEDSEKNARPIQALNGRDIRLYRLHHKNVNLN